MEVPRQGGQLTHLCTQSEPKLDSVFRFSHFQMEFSIQYLVISENQIIFCVFIRSLKSICHTLAAGHPTPVCGKYLYLYSQKSVHINLSIYICPKL